jgi:hypothetical protein
VAAKIQLVDLWNIIVSQVQHNVTLSIFSKMAAGSHMNKQKTTCNHGIGARSIPGTVRVTMKFVSCCYAALIEGLSAFVNGGPIFTTLLPLQSSLTFTTMKVPHRPLAKKERVTSSSRRLSYKKRSST